MPLAAKISKKSAAPKAAPKPAAEAKAPKAAAEAKQEPGKAKAEPTKAKAEPVNKAKVRRRGGCVLVWGICLGLACVYEALKGRPVRGCATEPLKRPVLPRDAQDAAFTDGGLSDSDDDLPLIQRKK